MAKYMFYLLLYYTEYLDLKKTVVLYLHQTLLY